MIVWRDGEFLAEGDAGAAVDDRGLLLGDGLFETLRVIDGRAIALDRHLARLTASAAALGLALPPDLDALADVIGTLTRKMNLPRAAVRISLSAGPGPRGLDRPRRMEASLLVTAAALAVPPLQVRLALSDVRRSPSSPACRHKTLSYVDNVLARRQARADKADLALLLDTQNRISGCDCANIFWLRDDAICTPGLDCGVLAGTARARLMAAFDVAEVDAPVSELGRADLVFVTNALWGAVPVLREGQEDAPGALARFAQMQAYLEQAEPA